MVLDTFSSAKAFSSKWAVERFFFNMRPLHRFEFETPVGKDENMTFWNYLPLVSPSFT